MKRLNIAMLGEQAQQVVEQEPVVVDQNNEALATDQDMSQIKQADAELDQVSSVVEETQDASDSITQTADKIEQMQTVSQEVVQVAQEQMNYFMKRTGMKMTGVSTAMESFSDGKTGNKEALVKQLRIAAESLDKGVSIAQEGIVDRVKDAFSVMFTSYDKLAKELEIVSKDFDEKGAKEEVIKDPAFARIFNSSGKSEIKSGDVVSFLDTAVKDFDDTSVIKNVRKMNEYMQDFKNITKDSKNFLWDDEAIKKYESLVADINTLVDSVEEELSATSSKNASDVEPLNSADKTKIVKKVQSILDTGNEYTKILKEYNQFTMWMVGAFKPKLGGDFSPEGRRMNIIKGKAFNAYRKLAKLAKIRFEVAHACVKYIKASTAN